MCLIWSRVDNFPPLSTLKPQIFDIRIQMWVSLFRQSALQINSVNVSALGFLKIILFVMWFYFFSSDPG